MALVLDIYARVSRLGDDRQRSTEGQVEDCEAGIGERGAQVGEVHIDSGRSAWNPRVRRPDWERLMSRLEAGATGGVVVFDMARFSRRPIEGERLILAAERGLVVLDSEGEYDLTTANGRKNFRDQLNAAAYESDRLSTRVKRGKRVKATRGEPNHSLRPFGFEQDGVTVRESESVVLREMVARVLKGENQDHIVRDLNQRGVTTSTGGEWSRQSLKQLLLRARNVGQVVHNDVVVGHLPGEPILDNETWERLNTLFASRRRGRPLSEVYLCSGIVCCAHCGHRLTGRPRVGLKPYPDGETRRQYWCQPRAVRGGCGRITIDQRELDWYIGALVVRTLADPRHAEAVEAAAKATDDKRRPLRAELSECEHLADELSGRLGRREITLKRYDVAMEPLDKRIAELRAELAELDSMPTSVPDPAIEVASREEWTARWNAATVTERRNLIRQALPNRRIVIAPAVRSSGPPKFDPKRILIEEHRTE
ncbi:MAG: recombinase family protein [Actinobacteria bacterium]|nr:recombinase family protein [Actinomycetota bacterium]